MRRTQDSKYRTGIKIPVLYPFITLRRERFGGILFNPFLAMEEELDKAEIFIAERCTGAHSMDSIHEKYRNVYNLSTEAAYLKIDGTIEKLKRLYAIRFADAPMECSPKPASLLRKESFAWFSAPKSIIWDITYQCNLSCPHCLTDSGRKQVKELDTDRALKLVKKFSEAKILHVSLVGGEPFMRRDIVKILEVMTESGMRVDIASNGYSIPKRVIRALRDLPVFQIQVSIDGIGTTHDEFRGREGAFENSCRSLRMLKEEGFSTSISTTATAKNLEQLESLIELAIDLGCDGFKAIPFVPAGRGKRNETELCLGKHGSLKHSQIIAERSKALEGRINIYTDSTFSHLLNPHSLENMCDGPMTCSAGYDSLNIGADGTAYPCPFFRDFPLGNVLASSLDKIWHESATLNDLRTLRKMEMTGPCSTCNFAPGYCQGGCRASAYLATGNFKGSDPLCFKELVTPIT